MKLKSLLFGLCLSLVGHSFAANQHVHPKANEVDNSNKASVAAKSAMSPGYCEIEIQNVSAYPVTVTGRFDDGFALDPFTIYPYEISHYISLHYYGYCHNSMLINLTNQYGTFYSYWTTPGTTLYIQPYMTNNLSGKNDAGNSVKVEVSKK
jgi:hypothetical protein